MREMLLTIMTPVAQVRDVPDPMYKKSTVSGQKKIQTNIFYESGIVQTKMFYAGATRCLKDWIQTNHRLIQQSPKVTFWWGVTYNVAIHWYNTIAMARILKDVAVFDRYGLW